jgi:hypothetical protein
MKNIIIILIFIFSFGCTKQPITTASQSNEVNTYFKNGKVDVWVNSNFKFPFVRFDDGNKIYFITNENIYQFVDSTEIHYSLTLKNGTYTSYSVCGLSSTDSTKYMKDSNQIYNYMKVSIGGKVVYENRTNRKNRSADNIFKFTLY